MINRTIGDKCINTYPNNIPIIVYYENIDMANINHKLLVPNSMTFKAFLILIRRKIKLPHNKSLTAFINNYQVGESDLISSLYLRYKNIHDGCLHIIIHKINMFDNLLFSY